MMSPVQVHDKLSILLQHKIHYTIYPTYRNLVKEICVTIEFCVCVYCHHDLLLKERYHSSTLTPILTRGFTTFIINFDLKNQFIWANGEKMISAIRFYMWRIHWLIIFFCMIHAFINHKMHSHYGMSQQWYIGMRNM